MVLSCQYSGRPCLYQLASELVRSNDCILDEMESEEEEVGQLLESSPDGQELLRSFLVLQASAAEIMGRLVAFCNERSL